MLISSVMSCCFLDYSVGEWCKVSLSCIISTIALCDTFEVKGLFSFSDFF